MSSHGHSHSYSHGHSYNYGQSQSYNQSYSNSQSYNNNQSYSSSQPYGRVSHSHHRRRYNYSPEPSSNYATMETTYQHNICETERDRDYRATRDKYSERALVTSSNDCDRDRNAHDRSDRNTDDRKHSNKTGKRKWNSSSTTSDWTEHISSSGKKYYYNSVTEVSQWEKPREWLEKRSSKYQYVSSRSAGHDKHESRSERDFDRNERVSHKRTNSAAHSNAYWRNNRPEHEESRNRPSTSAVHEEETQQQPQQHAYSVNNSRDVSYVKNDYDPRYFMHQSGLPRVGSHPMMNGSTATPPPPVAVEHHFTSPPTPTLENHTDHTPIVENTLSRRYEYGTYANLGSVPGPSLTSSLSNYYREDLLEHVALWPAEALERQAQRLCDETNALAKNITKVTAELKCARSTVREKDIRNTLHEQNVMYLRQRIDVLEEAMCPNSIMCDVLYQ